MLNRPIETQSLWSKTSGTRARLGPWLQRAQGAWGMGLTAASLLFLAACEQTPRNIADPTTSAAAKSIWFYDMLLLLCGVIFLLVSAAFVYALVRFRAKPGDKELPKQVHGNTQLEIMWTIAPTLIVIAITIPTLQAIFELEAAPAEGEEVVKINVIGKQWWWEYDYIDPTDPKKVMFTTANEVHVEEGTHVHLSLTSADVIHAWWVPRLSGKRDATPGREYPIYFKPEVAGVFVGQCAELCGDSHALMGIKVFVHPKEGTNSYDAWVESQLAEAKKPGTSEEEEGRKLFVEKTCNRCHTIRGSGDPSTQLVSTYNRTRTTGPELTHVGSRTTFGALAMKMTRQNLVQWIHDPASVKEGVIMADPRYNTVKITPEEAEKLAAYLIKLK